MRLNRIAQFGLAVLETHRDVGEAFRLPKEVKISPLSCPSFIGGECSEIDPGTFKVDRLVLGVFEALRVVDQAECFPKTKSSSRMP